jgi:hypothetical protein
MIKDTFDLDFGVRFCGLHIQLLKAGIAQREAAHLQISVDSNADGVRR